MTTMQKHLVEDDGRNITFTGEELAHASSDYAGKVRWIEFTLFRTRGGSYVLHRVGRSRKEGETDRHWATVSETAAGVIETLYLKDDDGVWYLTNVARTLLHDAALRDPTFNEPELVQ